MIATTEHRGFVLDGVTVRYPAVTALEGISLRVRAGERVGFIGPSGAGKTTLLRVLNGTVRPTAGHITVDGRDLADLAPAALRQLRSHIGFIPQDLSLVPNLRVIQNVMSGRIGQHSFLGAMRAIVLPRRREAAHVHEILERVGIAEKLYERTDRLSGGQQQRVAVARALFQQPIALLADEPVSSVDPARARDTVALLNDIAREQKLTLCMSLHNLDLAREFFPRLVGLRHGRIVFDQQADDLTDKSLASLYQLSRAEMLEDQVEA